MSTLSYKERERQRREQEILAAAERLIVERSYDALTMDDLADAVGISKPTLYQHFKSKDDLGAQVVIEALEMLEAHLIEPYTGSPAVRIEQIMRILLQQRQARGNILGDLGPELVLRALRSNPVLAEHKARVVGLLRQLVDEAKARNEIDANIPTQVIARTMFCLQGVLTDHDADPDCSLNGVIQLFLYGVTPRGSATSDHS